VKTLDIAGITGLLTRKDFAKNGASTFTFGDGSELRTFLAINDGRAGFNASSDSVIEITGYTGSLSTLAIF
jgi:serralysin